MRLSYLTFKNEPTKAELGDKIIYNTVAKTLAWSRGNDRVYFETGLVLDDKLSLIGARIEMVMEIIAISTGFRLQQHKNKVNDVLVFTLVE